MPNHIRHFAIPADDVERACAFYQSAFGWRITAGARPAPCNNAVLRVRVALNAP